MVCRVIPAVLIPLSDHSIVTSTNLFFRLQLTKTPPPALEGNKNNDQFQISTPHLARQTEFINVPPSGSAEQSVYSLAPAPFPCKHPSDLTPIPTAPTIAHATAIYKTTTLRQQDITSGLARSACLLTSGIPSEARVKSGQVALRRSLLRGAAGLLDVQGVSVDRGPGGGG